MGIKRDIDTHVYGTIGYVRRRDGKWYGCYEPGKIKSGPFNTEAEAERWLDSRDQEHINYATASLNF